MRLRARVRTYIYTRVCVRACMRAQAYVALIKKPRTLAFFWANQLTFIGVTCPRKCPRGVRSTSAAADIWNVGTVCLKI
jgi:hypothetical protein